MKQVLIRRGAIDVATVPAPLVEPGHVLVEVAYSLISTGTEMSGMQGSGQPLWQRALQQPDNVLKVIEHLREHGIQRTVARVKGQLETGHPTGYSCAGVVIQVGEGVSDLQPGERVACAGAGLANHAEIVLVPRNLVVKVPAGCDLKSAASVTLGAIALQGVRRADPRLGEIVAVIGLGLLGQLTVQLLKAAGCRVIGCDLDRRRVDLASQLGADHVFVSTEVDFQTEIRHLTDGYGVDAVIITAATESDAVVQQAMEMARKKGRVVVIGAVGLGVQRSPFYEKELDLLISCSYGPGRYDSRYEKQGVDYPYAFVRWTETRNMAEYLRLVTEGKIRLDVILDREYDLSEAARAYHELQTAAVKPLGVILRYPQNGVQEQAVKLSTQVPVQRNRVQGKIRIAVIGAGGFAKGVHLPNLHKLRELYQIRAIVSTTGSNAQSVARQYEVDYASTSYADVLADPEVDAVLICTPHHLHAAQAQAAAEAGKAVFLEKPMALHQAELEALAAVLTQTGVPFLVGFNRRFSPVVIRARALLANRRHPLMLFYRVNAGFLPRDHWTHGPQGGGRIVGEGCHMFDLFQALVSPARVIEVMATPIISHAEHVQSDDNVVATLRYDDGSVATLLYTALGTSDLPKEYVEMYYDNKTLIIDDFKALRVYGLKVPGWQGALADKGHLAELQMFARYVRGEIAAPIPLADLVETTRVSLLASGKPG
jgi:predicted dehydrogenase/threonine dehydrogenase-like Zn-dependent dehydrogenase